MAQFLDRPSMRYIVPVVEEEEGGRVVPELWEGETLDFTLHSCRFSWDASSSGEPGRLFITSKRVIWLGSSASYDFDVPYITLHAVSRDPGTYPQPCVYCQLDVEEQPSADDSEEEEESRSELFLIPDDEEDLLRLFEALSHAALLNPDPEEEDGGEFDDFIYNAEEVQLGAGQLQSLQDWESKFVDPEDAEGEDEGEECEGEGEEGEEMDTDDRIDGDGEDGDVI